MNMYEDYNGYMADMRELIKKLEETSSGVYVLIEDVLTVTKYIYEEHEKGSKLDEVLEEIFEAGFGYLSNVLSDISIMYHDYFNEDIKLFNYYAPLIVYSIYLEDYRCHLEAEELLTSEREEFIKNINYKIVEKFDHREFTDEDFFSPPINSEYSIIYLAITLLFRLLLLSLMVQTH